MKIKGAKILQLVMLVFLVSSFRASLEGMMSVTNAHAEEISKSVVERQYAVLKLANAQNPSIVDPVLQSLRDPDPLVRYAAAWTIEPSHLTLLGRRYSDGISQLKVSQLPKVIQAFLSGLSDRDPWVRVQFIETLAELLLVKKSYGLALDEEVKQRFIAQTSDSDPYIRSAATKGLQLWEKDSEARAALRRAFTDEVPMVRYSSFWAGYDDFDALTEAIRDENRLMRVRAVEFLSRRHLNDPRTIDLLIERLRDPDGQVVDEAIIGVRESKNPKGVKPLLDLLIINKLWEPRVRTAISGITGETLEEAMRAYSPPQPTPKSDAPIKKTDIRKQIEKLNRGGENARLSAVLALTWSEAPEAVNALIRALADPTPRVRYAAADVLGEHALSSTRQTDEVVNALLQVVTDPHPHVRRSAVNALERLVFQKDFKSDVFAQLFPLASTEQDPFVRAAILSTLSHMEGSSAGSPSDPSAEKRLGAILSAFIHDEFWVIRGGVVGSIDLSCYPEMIEQVFNALNDPVPIVRWDAIQNLSDNADILKKEDRERVKKKLAEFAKSYPSEAGRKNAAIMLETFEGSLSRPLANRSQHGCRGAGSIK